MFDFPNFNISELGVGKILLSEPFLSDNYFTRSVILIVEHDENGTVGFILNKISEVKVQEAIEDFPDLDAELYFGGPVNRDNLYFIHLFGDRIKNSKEILPGLFWGGEFNMLKDIIKAEQTNASDMRFFIGYSGWAPGQLEKELEEHSWIICDPKINLMKNSKNLWADILKALGPEYAQLINYPLDPNLN
jgi:putative transcriptional regulator